MSCDAQRGNLRGLPNVMNPMRTLGVVTLAVFLMAACGTLEGTGGSGGADPSPTAPSGVVVTMANDRGTVTAHVGDTIQIALGDKFTWQVDPPDGVVLARPTVQNYMLVRGTQAIWLAKSAGTSTIHATGGAVCSGNQPCPMYAVLFSATVTVLP
jgi:hypothetical protein